MSLSEYLMTAIEKAAATGHRITCIRLAPRDYTELCRLMGADDAREFCDIPVVSDLNIRIGHMHLATVSEEVAP